MQGDPFIVARQMKERNAQREMLENERKKLEVAKKSLSHNEKVTRELIAAKQEIIDQKTLTIKRLFWSLIGSNAVMITLLIIIFLIK
jgi:hypothetical protein